MMRFAAILATLTLSLSLVGCCGWHHRHHSRYSDYRSDKSYACQCPSNVQPQITALAPASVQ
jgi:hypothetical protein